MNDNIEEWLIVARYCDATPEFRAAQKAFDQAYSGPEQRGRTKHYRLHRESDRTPSVVSAKRVDIALAA